MTKNSNMHREAVHLPLAYFITIRTYGTWLHGDDRGSVDAKHNAYLSPLVPANAKRRDRLKQVMRHEPMLLAADSASLVEKTIEEVCAHRGWRLHVVKARTNHVHAVVAVNATAERVMNDLKAWATRRLREHGFAGPDQTVWVEHGSTPHLWNENQLLGAIDYVKNWQGGPLQKTWDEVQQELRDKERR